MSSLARLRAAPWFLYLAPGLLATGLYLALPSALAQNLAYATIRLTAVVAMLIGVRLHRPAHRLPWYLLALGDAIAVAGDLLWTYDENIRGITTPFPSIADALYLGGYLVFFAGVLLLLRTYIIGQDRATLIDAAILTIGVGIILWVFLVDPHLHNSTQPLLDRLAASAYPLVDILTLTAALRLTLAPGRRTPAIRLLILALVCGFATDVLYAILMAQGQYQTGHPVDAGWLIAYVLHGTVALHPSMRIRPASTQPEADLPRGRLPLLAVAALIGPGLLVFQAWRGAHIDVPVIVAASAILFLLALGRLRLLSTASRRNEARFRALVQSATDGIAIVGADGVALYQSPAAVDIVGFPPHELVGRDIFARLHPGDLAEAQRLFAALLALPGGTQVNTLRIRHADQTWRTLEVHGTNLLNEPSVGGIVLNYRDITEQHQAESLLAGQAAILERIAHDAPLAETLAQLAHHIEAAGDGVMISTRVLESDGTTLHCVAAPSLPATFAEATIRIPVGEGVGACGTAAFRGAPVIPADIATDPLWADYRDFTLAHGLQACWSIPIVSHSETSDDGAPRLLGTFAMYYSAPRQPGAAEWHAIDRSVGLAATAIERSRATAALREEERRSRELYAEAQRQARELALLDQVRTALASELNPAVVHRTIVEAIANTLGYPRIVLCLIQGDELVGAQMAGYDHLRDLANMRMPLTAGVIGRVARTGEPVLVTDVAADPDYRDVGDGTVSEICVPIRDEDRIVGALNVEATGTTTLDEDDLRLMVALGEHAGLAIGRARLYAEAQRQAQELALLDRVRTALARELDPAAVFRTIVEAIGSIFGHTRVSLYLLEGDALVRQSLVGPSADRFVRIPITRGIMGRVARTGQPVVLEDVDSDPEFIRVSPEIVSEVAVPLFDQGQVAGVLNLESTGGTRLGEADLHLMIGLSEQIGIAIGRARLYAEARSSADNLAAAQRIAHLGSWEEDLVTGRIIWSDEAFRINGQPPQSFVPTAERLAAAIHPEDRETVMRARRAAHEGAEPRPIDFRLVRPDGDIRVVHQQSEVIRDAQGRPVIRRGVILDVTERRALEARLAHQATHDPLTGLPNRMLLLDRLGQALARARRGGSPCAVLFLDLDNFKVVNDTLGHDAGDRLLVATADRLRHCLREGDTLARLGGDEFAALLGEVVDADEAIQVGNRLSQALEPPFPLDGQVYRIGASIGIVLSTPDHARPDDLLRDADIAMYRAKSAGDGGLALFDPAMQERIVERVALERDLRGALERGELSLHYQPVIDLASGQIVEAEALVRWRHPERGLVPPDIFVPVAEETGLIAPLGRWVLGEACRRASAWRDCGHPLVVAVNLSAREFGQADLAKVVAAALDEADLAPAQLRLEITERLAMRDAAVTSATLAALRQLGVQVAIDDFGTGYSSLAYLKRFPVDALKIDRSFVAGLGNSAEDAAIVGATTGLGRTLGLAVTAEGVETAAQVAHLRALGCDLAQGYFFSRPLEADAFDALLDTGLLADLPSAMRLPHAPGTGSLGERHSATALRRQHPAVIGPSNGNAAF